MLVGVTVFEFQYSKVQLKGTQDDYLLSKMRVSIREGAIEGQRAAEYVTKIVEFQYPKVQLKVLDAVLPILVRLVSIPEGAIEGDIAAIMAHNKALSFNTRRCN